MKQIYSDNSYEIFEYVKAYPRAFLASSFTTIQSDTAIIQTLFDSTFDRRESLILEKEPAIKPRIGSGSADIVSYKPNNVTVKTSSVVPKLLFLSDVFDPGWHATVDGKPSEIYRADYDFRAVAIPAGGHIVQFVYFPDSLRVGFMFAVMGFVIIFSGVFLASVI